MSSSPVPTRPHSLKEVVKQLISNTTRFRPTPTHTNRFANLGTAQLPEDFVELIECLPPRSERELGYFGDARYVAFRYEPRAEDVMWRDDRSFGISTGAWQAFLDEIQPLADLYDVNVGSNGRPATHVLLIDRTCQSAYFAPRESAEGFLAHRRDLMPGVA
jgi:hypothetical protein